METSFPGRLAARIAGELRKEISRQAHDLTSLATMVRILQAGEAPVDGLVNPAVVGQVSQQDFSLTARRKNTDGRFGWANTKSLCSLILT